MNIDKNVVDFSKYIDYSAFSDGYHWMTYDTVLAVSNITNRNTIEESLNSPYLWNLIGTTLFNMPYIKIDDVYQFVVPRFSDSVADDIIKQSTIGDMIEAFTKTDEFEISFSNKTKFILYNNKIVVENLEDEDDANIINIVYNVITLFLLQTLRRGQ
jgi:hypothetical protein